MITQEKIDRINQLAHKKKNEGLTEEEKQEQQLLYREYIDAFRENLKWWKKVNSRRRQKKRKVLRKTDIC